MSVQANAKNFSILYGKCMQITQSSTNYICKSPIKIVGTCNNCDISHTKYALVLC